MSATVESTPVALLSEGDYFTFNNRLCCVMEITDGTYSIEDCKTLEVIEISVNQFDRLKGVKSVRVRTD